MAPPGTIYRLHGQIPDASPSTPGIRGESESIGEVRWVNARRHDQSTRRLPSGSSTPLRLARWGTVLSALTLGLFLCAGCGRGNSSPIATLMDDPQLCSYDAAGPQTALDSEGGSFLLGSGWAPPARVQGPSGPILLAWATGRAASVIVRNLGLDRVDFYGYGFPLAYEGSPTQTVTLWKCRERLGSADMEPNKWQEIRIPIPRGALDRGPNDLRMEFTYAPVPREVLGTNDGRSLSAAFVRMALVPHDVSDGGSSSAPKSQGMGRSSRCFPVRRFRSPSVQRRGTARISATSIRAAATAGSS